MLYDTEFREYPDSGYIDKYIDWTHENDYAGWYEIAYLRGDTD